MFHFSASFRVSPGKSSRDDGTVASEDYIQRDVGVALNVDHLVAMLGLFPAIRRLVFVVRR